MAGELGASFLTGKTAYFLVRNRTSQIWSTSGGTGAFENYSTANYANYSISASEQGTASAYYTATMPAAVPAGTYGSVLKQQIAGSVAETDPTVAAGNVEWNGTALTPLSDVATSGQIGQIAPLRISRGVAVSGFPIYLVSAADHVSPFTSGVVSGQISRNGGSFGPLQSGTISETGLGVYRCNFTSGDLLADTIAVVFTATGISGGNADSRVMSMILQKVSGVN